jgi:hypothetical protein
VCLCDMKLISSMRLSINFLPMVEEIC